MHVHVEQKLGEWQYGFRPNRSTTDLIFSTKMILEKTWEYNEKTYLAFLDLEKAFHRVPRHKLWQAMKKQNIKLHQSYTKSNTGMYSEC